MLINYVRHPDDAQHTADAARELGVTAQTVRGNVADEAQVRRMFDEVRERFGYLDILVMKGPKSDAFTLLPRAYRGEHLPHPNIIEYRAKQVRVETARPLWIEADGLVLGRTPATFEVVPGAIRLKI